MDPVAPDIFVDPESGRQVVYNEPGECLPRGFMGCFTAVTERVKEMVYVIGNDWCAGLYSR
ncbi:hypothetical protein IFM47457_00750 [Aspergillus lentulus]|nr:hypothetical protein IFM47457_00750 [Aspergillus lentulus]